MAITPIHHCTLQTGAFLDPERELCFTAHSFVARRKLLRRAAALLEEKNALLTENMALHLRLDALMGVVDRIR
jgi:hypothetical protein